jgi:hypothetical protein
MNKKLNRKELNALEKRLIDKNTLSDYTILSLHDSDFCSDGKLSVSGYSDLKENAKQISMHEHITITIPPQFIDGFSETLEEYISHEITTLRKDIKLLKWSSLLLFLLGVLVFGLNRLLDDARLFYEVSIVAF